MGRRVRVRRRRRLIILTDASATGPAFQPMPAQGETWPCRQRARQALRTRAGITAIAAACALLLATSALGLGGSARAQTSCPPTPVPSPSPTPEPPPPAPTLQVCYPPGWNLVGGPFTFPVPLWIWDPTAAQYNELPAGSSFPQGLDRQRESNGQGAWAYFAQTTAVSISVVAPSVAPVTVALQAGQWQQIGNPFNARGDAVACRAGVSVFTYDPMSGAYSQATTLHYGQGAWAYSATSGSLMLAAVNAPPGFGCPSS